MALLLTSYPLSSAAPGLLLPAAGVDHLGDTSSHAQRLRARIRLAGVAGHLRWTFLRNLPLVAVTRCKGATQGTSGVYAVTYVVGFVECNALGVFFAQLTHCRGLIATFARRHSQVDNNEASLIEQAYLSQA